MPPATTPLLRRSGRQLLALLRSTCLPGLLCGLLLLAMLQPADAQILHIDTALSAVGAGSSFPADLAATPTKLPDDWGQSHPDSAGPVWYRIGFLAPPREAGAELQALYIEHVCSNLDVFLNGELVHNGDLKPQALSPAL